MCNDRLQPLARPVSLLLLASYPVTLHLGVLGGVMWPALAILAALFLLPPLLRRPTVGRLLWLVAGVVVLVLLFRLAPETVQTIIYAPPLLINLLLFLLFARSLLPGHEPFASHVARLLHDRPSQVLLNYTRTVTLAWAVFLAVILCEVIYLGLFASLELWSLFTNFYNYLFMGLFFLLEYSLRGFFVPSAERMPLREFFRRLSGIDLRIKFWQ